MLNSDLPGYSNTSESEDTPLHQKYIDASPLSTTPHLEFAGHQELYTNNDKEVELAKHDHSHQLYDAHAQQDEEGYAAPVNLKDLARKEKKEKLALARIVMKRATTANELNPSGMTWSEVKSMTEMGAVRPSFKRAAKDVRITLRSTCATFVRRVTGHCRTCCTIRFIQQVLLPRLYYPD